MFSLTLLMSRNDMVLARVSGRAVNNFFVGCHLLPDRKLGVCKYTVLCGNVLDPVVQLYKVVAYSGQIAAGGEVPALVQPHIPPVCLEVKIVDYIFGHLQPLHVLHINAPQRFIVRYAGVEVVAIQIVNEVPEAVSPGRGRARTAHRQ